MSSCKVPYARLRQSWIFGTDVISAEDFEVAIFLTETSNRHCLLYKQKTFKEPNKKSMLSNSSKLTGSTGDAPIEVEDGPGPAIAREDSEEDGVNLQGIPDADEVDSEDGLFVDQETRGSKRTRATTGASQSSSPGCEPLPKRRRDDQLELADDKKKMAMDTTYDGFSIHGRVLCLVVKRKDNKGQAPAGGGGGQATMENWISSTQMPPPDDD